MYASATSKVIGSAVVITHSFAQGAIHLPVAGTAGQILVNSSAGSGSWGNATFSVNTHVHGNITNDGKIGSTAGLIIKTGTSGLLTALAAGSSGQYLKYDGTWDTPPGTYTHPAYTGITLSGANVLSSISVNSAGTLVTASRVLTAGDIDAAKASTTVTGTGLLGGGGDLSTDRTITHNIANGAYHLPINGSAGQILVNSSDGSGSWSNVILKSSNLSTRQFLWYDTNNKITNSSFSDESFALSGHSHTTYVSKTGDTMTGDLNLTGHCITVSSLHGDGTNNYIYVSSGLHLCDVDEYSYI
jgi:hypothetical protein